MSTSYTSDRSGRIGVTDQEHMTGTIVIGEPGIHVDRGPGTDWTRMSSRPVRPATIEESPWAETSTVTRLRSRNLPASCATRSLSASSNSSLSPNRFANGSGQSARAGRTPIELFEEE